MAVDPKALQAVGLFAGLPPPALAELARAVTPRRLEAGATLFRRGAPGDGLAIVLTGRLRIQLATAEGREVTLALAGPGTVVGEMALLDGEPRSADAVATAATTLLWLTREAFAGVLARQPGIALALLADASRRLRQANTLLEGVALLPLEARVARLLLDASDQGRMPVRHSQGEIAGMIAASRPKVNRALAGLAARNLVRVDRTGIRVLDAAGLASAGQVDTGQA
jgi:CRP-like cAMP-binding protein